MKIDPAIAATYWEQATVEQLTRDLRAQGYDVEREVRVGDRMADRNCSPGFQAGLSTD